MGLFSRTKNINTKEIKTRRPRKLIVYGQTNQASLETWVEAERRMANSRLRRQRAEGLGKEELAHLEALFKEPNLGLTIPQQEFHIYTEGELQDIVTHAEEPCAPQYYKGGGWFEAWHPHTNASTYHSHPHTLYCRLA
eukprot:Blabericola_migrator_1__830@NODE_1203_length_5119_cov_116_367577_g815_i0_p5_GENE_NODE_1203_length_5119_cov_116_367577_g815_i0NODE_1203_length_5119_cov_116_367577_g815_i0_p5_ORF_typecomplete_len138_score22_10DUF4263/PF14082_6/0_099_NODE_1203_length_5119_cov_116_367577_g815_i045034916